VSGDIFDFSVYEARRASPEVTAVRVLVSTPSQHPGMLISYREYLIVPQKPIEEPAGNDPAKFG
jgi:hypothetical protein